MQTNSFIQTEDKNTHIETYHYHESVLDKARRALGDVPQEERDYYALTLPLPREMFAEIVDDLYAFRDKIVQKVNARAREFDEVYQVNFQLFPVTKS